MEIGNKIILSSLKEKLQQFIKSFFSKTISFQLLYLHFFLLKHRYKDKITSFNFLHNLRNLFYKINENTIYSFISSICIIKLQDKPLIKYLLKFVDISTNYELEERVKKLEKEIIELKNICSELKNVY